MNDVRPPKTLMQVVRLVSDQATSDTVPPGSSQLSAVAFDLAKSVCEAGEAGRDPQFEDEWFLNDFVETQSERIRKILMAIPSAFHHFSLRTRDGRDISPFDLRVPELNEAIKDIADMEPKKVVEAFGVIWRHVRALGEVQAGEKPKAHKDLCLHTSEGGLEYVAELYLESDDFASPFLEAALVDALIHYRILDFASSRILLGLLPMTPEDQMIDGPLLPGTRRSLMGLKRPSFLATLGQTAVEITTELAVEAVILVATWWFSGLLAGPEGLAKWILFTGATAARWVVSAVRGKGAAALEATAKGETNLRMMWDMGIAQDRAPAMNVGLLRHLLFRLEERGAAFHPAVYSILDKRAKRESGR